MSTSRVNPTFYLVVLTVALSCIIITPLRVCEASPYANDAPYPPEGNNNSTENENHANDQSETAVYHFIVEFLIQLVYYLYKFLYWPCYAPFYILNALYMAFVYTPTVYVWKVLSLFSPLLAFCSAAAFFGICIGATAGWFSEVIIGVLTAPSNDEVALNELKKKRHVAKLRRQLANLKARNGGRIPKEFYRRQGATLRKNILQNGMFDDYGSDYRKDYSAGGE
ncbi:9140_t:CDS:1 [Acaulospora morrowiae]|uniref:9140_t:CDS:1 n=1 Tax=Acaulospora morrowiae TaxID=94023 RepID=A0A9N9I3D5_9GLOM|nr:9140_t:CDS:1 [Acaulospora morrowiae]